MSVTNSTILDRCRLVATNEYQQRIPPTTQGGIASTMRALFDPLNREYWNQFIDILVNRIGMTIVRGDQWDNPLAAFKGAKLDYGSTIQEIAPQWIKAHSYDDADETLLKLERPQAQAWYHSQNRRDKYKISINEQELRTAFTDDYGLNNFVMKIMQVPYNSDNYDEYRIMMQLIAEYEKNWGFYKQGLEAYNAATFDTKAFNEEFLTYIQAYAGMLRFPSQLYNAQDVDIPVFAAPDELILMITPKALAGLNVQTLANVFNLELAEIKYRTVIVDEFPIPHCDAILTTRDFFVCHDTLYQTDTFYDPNTLSNHYFLHHWGVYSVSPFVPAIMFGNFETTGVGSITYTREQNDVSGIAALYMTSADGVTVANYALASQFGSNPHTWDKTAVMKYIMHNPGEVLHNSQQLFTNELEKWGGSVHLALIVSGKLVSTSDFSNMDAFTNTIGAGANWNVTLNVVGEAADGSSYSGQRDIGNSATYIDQYGVLHFQKSRPRGLEYPDNLSSVYVQADITVDDWSYTNPSYADTDAAHTDVAQPVMPITAQMFVTLLYWQQPKV